MKICSVPIMNRLLVFGMTYFHLHVFVWMMSRLLVSRAVGKEGDMGVPGPPPHFLLQNFFSYIKSEHIKFLHVKNIRVYLYKWQKLDSLFLFCHFSSKLSYHSYHQRVCKIMFPIRTFVKTNNNLMCGSFLLCQVIARTPDTKTESKIISC